MPSKHRPLDLMTRKEVASVLSLQCGQNAVSKGCVRDKSLSWNPHNPYGQGRPQKSHLGKAWVDLVLTAHSQLMTRRWPRGKASVLTYCPDLIPLDLNFKIMLKIHGDSLILYYLQLNVHLYKAPSTSDILPKESAQ